MLAGCASTSERERHARVQRYDALLSQIKPGATRGDLRPLLPLSARVRSFTSSMITSPDFPFEREIYALDSDFSVVVVYTYQRRRWQQNGSLRIYPQAADRIDSLPLRAQPTASLASLPFLVRPQ